MKEFADHPVTVSCNPNCNGNIVAKLTHVLPGAPAYNNGDNKCRDNHDNAQCFPTHTPAYIFKQPENNMQVFHLTVADGDIVGLFLWHVSSYKL